MLSCHMFDFSRVKVMKTFFAYIVLVVFLYVSLPAPVNAQSPVGQDDSIGSQGPLDEVFPLGMNVYPKLEAVSIKQTTGKIGVHSATIPFFNEFGRALFFKVDFSTSTWIIDDAGGILAGGALTTAQHDDLKFYALDRLKPYDQRTLKNAALVIAIISLIIGALALGFQVLSYLNDLEQQRLDNIREGNICAGQMVTQTAMAWDRASASCPMTPVKEADGRICWKVPEMRNGDPQACRGMTFTGRCNIECN
jgi:hypothetical protein